MAPSVVLLALIQVHTQRPDAHQARVTHTHKGPGGVVAAGSRVAGRGQDGALVQVLAPGAVARVAQWAVTREGARGVPTACQGVTHRRTVLALVSVHTRPALLVVPPSAGAMVRSGQVSAHLVGTATGIVQTLVYVSTAQSLGVVAGQARAQEGPQRVVTRGVVWARAATRGYTFIHILALCSTQHEPPVTGTAVRAWEVDAGGVRLTAGGVRRRPRRGVQRTLVHIHTLGVVAPEPGVTHAVEGADGVDTGPVGAKRAQWRRRALIDVLTQAVPSRESHLAGTAVATVGVDTHTVLWAAGVEQAFIHILTFVVPAPESVPAGTDEGTGRVQAV